MSDSINTALLAEEGGRPADMPKKKGKGHCVGVILLGVVVVATLAVSATLGGIVATKVGAMKNGFEALDPNATWNLPKTFLVPDHSRTPVKNQASRGTCYIFSTMSAIEGSYKKYGYEHGFLEEGEYVKFSEQAYGIGLVKHCQEHPEDRYCFAGPAKNKTADGEAEWLYYMRDAMVPYVLPDAVCPYKTTDDGQFECEGLDAALEANPLKFTVKGVRTAYTVDQIKRLMYEVKQPLTWSHAVHQATYTIPCDDPAYSLGSSEQCLQCYHPCTESSTGCCAEHNVAGYDKQGIFSLFDTPKIGGGHAMNVVGWNDELTVVNGRPGADAHVTKGGFIIKNSWDTTIGHSAEYWAQMHSNLDENYICPCEQSSHTWVPAEKDCMLEKKDPLACSSLYKYVQKEFVYGGTVLKCRAFSAEKGALHGWTGCDESKRYVLVHLAGEQDPWTTFPVGTNGMMQFHLVEYDPADATAEAKLITTNATTWYNMEQLFTPETVKGNTEHCGYYFFPYETFNIGLATYPVIGHDPIAISYLDIEWDESSFLKSGKKNKGDTSLIEKSTYTQHFPKFDGPFDIEAKN